MNLRGSGGRALVQLWWTQLIENTRDGLAAFVLVPFLVIGLLGFTFDRGHGSVAVFVPEGAAGDALAKALDQKGVELQRGPASDAEERLRRGRAVVAVLPGDVPELHADATNPDSNYARLLVNDALQRSHGRQDPLVIKELLEAPPGRRYVDFLVPGLLAFMLMTMGVTLASGW